MCFRPMSYIMLHYVILPDLPPATTEARSARTYPTWWEVKVKRKNTQKSRKILQKQSNHRVQGPRSSPEVYRCSFIRDTNRLSPQAVGGTRDWAISQWLVTNTSHYTEDGNKNEPIQSCEEVCTTCSTIRHAISCNNELTRLIRLLLYDESAWMEAESPDSTAAPHPSHTSM